MPHDLKPMLASRTLAPFDDPEWIYEIKWDGYRTLAYVDNGHVALRSRNNQSYELKYRSIATALEMLSIRAVLDGEIIAMDADGAADFQALQGYEKNGGTANLVYQVFDILWHDGKSTTDKDLLSRKILLKTLLKDSRPEVNYSDHIEKEGILFFEQSVKFGLEGIMAKDSRSIYLPGVRSKSWLKIKNDQRTEAIICGYTEGRNSREHFGAIILGKYTSGILTYIGHTGTGFTEELLHFLKEKMDPLKTQKMPFKKKPKTNMPVTWIKPKMVCDISFTEITQEGLLRHPVFHGLREDKNGDDERFEEIA